ncbi:hypothetical protein [Pelomonas cellulosilytica]|uniref:Uncharacterized protein n=1 Tax=Pelomonas cellulosilytica TaxID=2906762 RepID=A0ABS8XXE2_9BURK|nr:hypothetical protein [Pelomonas sp. P8]MCE4555522.1 hypothetical protein [Pelomonas sp. P8]
MTKLDRLPSLAALLPIGAWMILAHSYMGIRHDGVLYLGQALLHSQAPSLSQDTFFAGGSQDRYSIYGHLMAPLYEHVGMLPAHVAVLAASWLAMMAAVGVLLRRFEPSSGQTLWGMLAFAVMSPFYGGSWIFSYTEAFVTARGFAEPLLLWSFVALLAGRWHSALALQSLAALFHPLMTLPVIVVSWGYLVAADRRWLWLIAVLPVTLIAALADLAPWNGLLRIYDPYWWSLIETGNRQVLLAYWTMEDKLGLLLDLTVLMAVTRLRGFDAWTRLLHAIVLATLALVGLTAVAADGLHSVLITQLQLWRVHWITHLFAMALSPWLLTRLWQCGGLWPASACALGLALLNAHIGMDHGLPALGLWAATSLAAWRLRKVSAGVVHLVCGSILLCVLALSGYQIDSLLEQQHWRDPNASWNDRFATWASFPTVAVASFALLISLARRGRAGVVAALSAGTALMGVAILSWDQRPDLERAVESQPPHTHPFIAHLPAKATVYWPTQLLTVWGLLERPSHYAAQQGAGVLFNRDTGLIFGPRKEGYRRINEDRERCLTGASLAKDLAARLACEMPARERLESLCRQNDAPDYLVLRGRLPLEPLATWQPPVHRDPPQNYALYACSQLNAQGT